MQRRRLGEHDLVADRQGLGRRRHLARHDLGAGRDEHVDEVRDPGPHGGVAELGERAPGHGDPQAGEVADRSGDLPRGQRRRLRGSAPSGPRSTANSRSASRALRAIGPTVSVVHDSGKTPVRGIAPAVGLSPVSPHHAEGRRTDPPTSVPSAHGTARAATAAADPVDDPPAQRSRSHGLRTAPKRGGCGPPTANSVVASLLTAMAPASSRRRTTVADAVAGASPWHHEPAVVGTPATSMTSLTPNGTPSRGRGVPDAQRRADSAAAARARSSRTRMVQFSASCATASRARASSTTSIGSRTLPRRTPRAIRSTSRSLTRRNQASPCARVRGVVRPAAGGPAASRRRPRRRPPRPAARGRPRRRPGSRGGPRGRPARAGVGDAHRIVAFPASRDFATTVPSMSFVPSPIDISGASR